MKKTNQQKENKYESDLHSNEHYLSSSENKAWKKIQACRGLNPWPLRYQSSALPTELTRSYFHHCSSSVFIRSSNIWLSYIHIPLLLYFTGLFGTKKIPALSWLVSSVGRALDWYRRGHGFKSHTGLNFFSGLIFTTAQVLFITAKIAFILTSLSAVQIYDFHIFTVI